MPHDRSVGKHELNIRFYEAQRSNQWGEDVLLLMRQHVSANEEALLYLDRAAPLEFKGFFEYDPAPYNLHPLFPVAELRTTILAVEGKGDEAALSLYSAVRFMRTKFWAPDGGNQGRKAAARRPDSIAVIPLTRQLQMLVSRTQPTVKNLALLEEAFAALDDDDLLLHHLLWSRAAMFKPAESIPTVIRAPLYRPFQLHEMNARLRDHGDLIAAQAGKGWPGKLNALPGGEHDFPPSWFAFGSSVAEELSLIRAARAIIGIEQYRRANAERLPEQWSANASVDAPFIDPHTGEKLKVRVSGSRYSVYSVGPNLRDDGGDVDLRIAQAADQNDTPAPDVGISVTLQP